MKDYINIGPAACARSSSKLILYSFKSGKQALAFFFQLTLAFCMVIFNYPPTLEW